jgi:glucoamylase
MAAVVLQASPALAADAPGAPGIQAAWTTGGKQGFGTSATSTSKVWFTLSQGIANEVYYPTADVANVQDLQYVVSDGSTFTQLERDNTSHQIVLTDPQSLSYRQVNTANNGRYRITKTYATDPARDTVLIQTRFQVLSGGALQLYVLYNPSLNNGGRGDTARSLNGTLVAVDGSIASGVAASTGFTKLTSGYSGTVSDGYTDLSADQVLDDQFATAGAEGNIVQLGQIPVGTDTTFALALGFGTDEAGASSNASASLAAGFTAIDTSYRNGWHTYLASLGPVPHSITGGGLTTQYDVAVMTLKGHEDKTHLGANVASLTIPWGDAKNGDHPGDCGYHAVWARDLYEVSTAQIAAGDTAAANRSVDYLFNTQQRPDGSFPQNSHLDGADCFGGRQLDEVAFPIVLAWQLGRSEPALWPKIKRAADYLLAQGPRTPQERWEENDGFSPSTIAAEIAGLVCASALAAQNGDQASATSYLATADAWQRNVENLTFTTIGHLGDGRYYERIDGEGQPNDTRTMTIRNDGGEFEERDVLDAGFLELVRLGVKPAADAAIAASLPEIDATIKVDTPNGPMWRRYNHDGYGETSGGAPFTGAGVGRLWPIFTGERGEYELANGRPATTYLTTMAAAANPGYMIPEQVWDQASAFGFTFGEGTGSATPLAWSMAQFVRLAHSIDAGRPVEAPSIVKSRYAATGPCASVAVSVNVDVTTTFGQNVYLVGDRPDLDSWNTAHPVALSPITYPIWKGTVNIPKNTTFQYKYIRKDSQGNVTWESGANRVSSTTTGCTSTLTDTWRA